jgi:hypothetical protein
MHGSRCRRVALQHVEPAMMAGHEVMMQSRPAALEPQNKTGALIGEYRAICNH